MVYRDISNTMILPCFNIHFEMHRLANDFCSSHVFDVLSYDLSQSQHARTMRFCLRKASYCCSAVFIVRCLASIERITWRFCCKCARLFVSSVVRVLLPSCECADTVGCIKRKIKEHTGIACEDQMLGTLHGSAWSLEHLPNNVLLLRNMCVSNISTLEQYRKVRHEL